MAASRMRACASMGIGSGFMRRMARVVYSASWISKAVLSQWMRLRCKVWPDGTLTA